VVDAKHKSKRHEGNGALWTGVFVDDLTLWQNRAALRIKGGRRYQGSKLSGGLCWLSTLR
jgi:hypothetical protein